MKIVAPIAVILLFSFLSGCGSFGNKQEDVTIASLRDRPLQVIPDRPIERSRSHALDAYRNILGTSLKSEQNPEVMRRLADMLTDIDAYGDDDDELNPQIVAEAIELYNKVLSEYPAYPRREEVLYHLARIYDQNSQLEESQKILDQLVTDFPDSKYYAEAQFRRGEFLFVGRKYAQAHQAYSQVLKKAAIEGKESSAAKDIFSEPARYKKGWANYKQNKYADALDDFMIILEKRLQKGQPDFNRLSRADRERINDTLRAVSLCFVYQDGVDSLTAFFRDRGAKQYESLVYEKLAEFYAEKKRHTDTASTYAAFLDRNPWHEQAPGFQSRVIKNLRKGHFPKQELEAREKYVKLFAPGSDYWKYYPAEKHPEVLAQVKTHLTDLGKHYHAAAQKNKNPDDFIKAQQWYKYYIDSFPGTKDTAGTHFLLAESYYQNGQIDEAIKAWNTTAYDYPEHNLSAKAAYSALLGFQELDEKAFSDKTELKTVDDESLASEAWVKAALKFNKHFPQHEKSNEVLVSVAQKMFDNKDYPQAMQVAETLLKKKPAASQKEQKVVWTIAAHSRFESKNYQEAELGYIEALKLTATTDPTRQDLTERLAASVYRQAEAFREKGNNKEAVTQFLRVATVAPAAKVAAVASYDAAVVLIKSGQWKQATPILESFRHKYPAHKLQQEVDKNLATAYLKTDQPAKAAAEFERVAATGANPEIRKEALLNASDLYAKSGDELKSMFILETYVKDFPRPVEPAVEAAYKLAGFYEKRHDIRTATEWYQQVIDSSKQPEGNSDRVRFLAAKSGLAVSKSALQAYESVYLIQPMKNNLKQKKKLMQVLLAEYGRLADYKIAEVSTETTYRSGYVYYDFSKAILDSEKPANLEIDAFEEYELLLEEQAIPFEEKAIEIHEINTGRIADGVYDEWVQKSFQDLKELLPARYNKEEADGGPVTRIH